MLTEVWSVAILFPYTILLSLSAVSTVYCRGLTVILAALAHASEMGVSHVQNLETTVGTRI